MRMYVGLGGWGGVGGVGCVCVGGGGGGRGEVLTTAEYIKRALQGWVLPVRKGTWRQMQPLQVHPPAEGRQRPQAARAPQPPGAEGCLFDALASAIFRPVSSEPTAAAINERDQTDSLAESHVGLWGLASICRHRG